MEEEKKYSATKTYLTGLISAILALFLVSGVVFLLILSNKLDIIMSSPSGITYTYFMMIMDRVMAFLIIFVLIPLTINLWKNSYYSPTDKSVSFISLIILFGVIVVFLGGELRFYNKYTLGELQNSKLFSKPTIEMKIFDTIKTK